MSLLQDMYSLYILLCGDLVGSYDIHRVIPIIIDASR